MNLFGYSYAVYVAHASILSIDYCIPPDYTEGCTSFQVESNIVSVQNGPLYYGTLSTAFQVGEIAFSAGLFAEI
jgi:hypothetical protein